MPDSHNVITIGFSKYLNSLIIDNSQSMYLAIGSGSPTWDISGPQAISSAIDRLINEDFRVLVDSIVYVDPSNNHVSTNPTSRIRIYAHFIGRSAEVREYGLFISDTDEINTGILINYCNHPKIEVNPNETFSKYIYIDT